MGIETFLEQKASINPKPYLFFENLPIDDSVVTTPVPNMHLDRIKSSHISENLIVLFSLMLGEPYSIKFEGESVVNNLIPLGHAKNDYTGLGSAV